MTEKTKAADCCSMDGVCNNVSLIEKLQVECANLRGIRDGLFIEIDKLRGQRDAAQEALEVQLLTNRALVCRIRELEKPA